VYVTGVGEWFLAGKTGSDVQSLQGVRLGIRVANSTANTLQLTTRDVKAFDAQHTQMHSGVLNTSLNRSPSTADCRDDQTVRVPPHQTVTLQNPVCLGADVGKKVAVAEVEIDDPRTGVAAGPPADVPLPTYGASSDACPPADAYAAAVTTAGLVPDPPDWYVDPFCKRGYATVTDMRPGGDVAARYVFQQNGQSVTYLGGFPLLVCDDSKFQAAPADIRLHAGC
jgi:hypothetical protein